MKTKNNSQGINVLSLFDGMSCGQIALQRAGIKVHKYFASEIDKYAIKVTQANFPKTRQLGDVKEVRASGLPKIDLLIGGSPCQGFSFSGKRLNFDDPRSALFFEFVRLYKALKRINPQLKFLLENVPMAHEHELVISQYLGTWPIKIDSALVSAQSRERLYWTNINEQPYGLFGDMRPNIPQPKDKGIVLKDILEEHTDEKFFLSKKALEGLFKRQQEQVEKGNGFRVNIGDPEQKSNTILARYGKEGKECLIVEGDKAAIQVDSLFTNNAQAGRIYSTEGKSVALKALGGGLGAKSGLYKVGVLSQDSQGERVYSTEGKSPTLNANSGGTAGAGNALITDNKYVLSDKAKQKIIRRKWSLPRIEPDKTGAILPRNNSGQLSIDSGTTLIRVHQQDSINDAEGKANCLVVGSHQNSSHFTKTLIDNKIRRLTEVECERLQTVDDNYTNHVSSTQRYKILGNGWTVDVIVHFFSFLKKEIG